MPVSHKFTEKQKEEIKTAQKKNKNKVVDKRLTALLMRAEGKSRKETAERTGYKYTYITTLTAKYINNGIEAIVGNHYKGNCRNLEYEKEKELLEQFKKAAEQGQIVEVSAIKEAYDKEVGRITAKSQIYSVLHRHNWRKVMPRSKHPKKASEEAIEASKKLKLK